MSYDYFLKLNQQTDTRFWINNPSFDEAKKSIQHGAVSCTTNPAYCSRLITVENEYIRDLIDEAVRSVQDYDEIALNVYRKTAKRLMDLFMPIYIKSNGRDGFVTLQDDPRKDMDASYIAENARINKLMSPNYMAKIPVIDAGIQAIEYCVNENIPICATEVFTIAQVIDVCEAYAKASSKSGNKPIMTVTHISGIFDEYLGKVAKREGISIDPTVLNQAGIAIARKEYKILQKSGFTLLGGGARGTHHFLELVGGNAHITINWSTAEEIMQSETDIYNTVEKETSQDIIDELKEKFPEFKMAYEEDGLKLSEYEGYGPVQLFRNAFLKGWYLLLAEIAARKNYLAL